MNSDQAEYERHLAGDHRLANWFMAFSLCICATGVAIGGYQCVLWLRDGYWTELPLGEFIPQNPSMNWDGARGAQKIWDAVMDFSVAWAVSILGAVFFAWALQRYIETSNRLHAARQR